MELLLWRHAEAAQAAPDQADIERPLTARGHTQAQRMANWLQKQAQQRWQAHHLNLIISPATRCQQTAQALTLAHRATSSTSQSMGFASICQTTVAEIQPSARLTDILALLDSMEPILKAENTRGVALLVGHQPWLGQLAAWLLTGQEANWTIKKGALWWFSTHGVNENDPQKAWLRCVMPPGMTDQGVQ